jgi:hypothetical protein
MRIVVCAVMTATLAGCSAAPAEWRAETVPVVMASPTPAAMPPPCPPLDPGVAKEAARVTPLEALRAGGIDGFAAALLRSEAEKNARLRQAWAAHQKCFRATP